MVIMNLAETIDKCIELVKEEIEVYEYYISEFGYKDSYSAAVKVWKEGIETGKEHLNNLEVIKHETGLQEIDEIIENESKRTN
jgi:glutamate mutase epsilon subunit